MLDKICSADTSRPSEHPPVRGDVSHIQRIVLATEETCDTTKVSHRPIKNANPARGHKEVLVNGSHHSDNPLLRPESHNFLSRFGSLCWSE